MQYSKPLFIFIALFTVTMWGLTFVSTKSLINAGMTPFDIFMSRFAIAYVCILAIYHKKFRANSLRDELFFASMGLTGGSLYFMTENTALGITFASNVAMLISTTPLLTLFAGHFMIKTKITGRAIAGGLIALVGVALVVYNGAVNFGINPLGDLLTILAAICWAVYCVQIKQIDGKYSNLFITRKVFFYGLVTGLLFLPFVEPGFLSSFNSTTESLQESNPMVIKSSTENDISYPNTLTDSGVIPTESLSEDGEITIRTLSGDEEMGAKGISIERTPGMIGGRFKALMAMATSPVIIWNLLFLGLIASFLCYFLWNMTIKAIGPAKASNFIYFNPLVAIIASSIILHEPLSAATLAGAAAIIAGVYLSTR